MVLFAAVASADVTLMQSAELPIADRVVCSSNVVDRSNAVARGSGGQSLIVWLDERYHNGPQLVMAARIDASGALVDATGVAVGSGGGVPGYEPGVAFDGTHYLVAWANGTGVFAARVTADGTVLDTTPIAIATSGEAPAPVGANGQFAVAWRDAGTVLVKRIGDDGTLLDAAPLTLGSGSFIKEGPAGASDGSSYAFVWDATSVQAARIATTGGVIAPGQVDLVAPGVGGQPTPSIVFSGTEYMVAWNAGGLAHLRVSTSLAPVGSADFAGGPDDPPAIAYDGTRYTLATEDDVPQSPGQLQLLRVSTANADLGFQSARTAGPAYFGHATLVYTGTKLLLGYTTNAALYGTTVAGSDGSVTPASSTLWSPTQSDQFLPAAAFDGTAGYVAAWLDSRDPGLPAAVVAGRFTEAGAQDGSGVVLGHTTSDILGHIAVARARAAGSTSLVVWNDPNNGQLRAARVDSSGTVLDPGGVLIATTSFDTFATLDVACTATTCLVTWADAQFSVHIARIGLDGTLIDATPVTLGSGQTPRVAASSDGFLVLYGGGASLVPAQGAPQALQLPASAGAGGFDAEWDGSHFATVWTEQTGMQITLKTQLVDATGHAIGSAQTLASTTTTMFVTLAYDGSHFVAAWLPLLSVSPDSVQVARLASDGSALDPGGVTLATGTGFAGLAGGAGHVAVLRQADGTPGTRAVVSFVAVTGDNPGGGDGGGGGPGGKGGGGCCQTDRGGSGSAALGVVVAAMLLRRRRRR